jgi:Domain of unknown function (DUF1844)
VSSLWTPGGERPVGRPSEPPPPEAPDRLSDEEVAERVEAMRADLVNAPVEVVVANHCYGLFELAAVYLSQQPPLLRQAQLAIDALGVLVDGLAGRLGEAESSLRDGLAQLRLAYVQIDGAQRAGAEATSGAGSNGDGATDNGATSDTAGSGDGQVARPADQPTEQPTDQTSDE